MTHFDNLNGLPVNDSFYGYKDHKTGVRQN